MNDQQKFRASEPGVISHLYTTGFAGASRAKCVDKSWFLFYFGCSVRDILFSHLKGAISSDASEERSRRSRGGQVYISVKFCSGCSFGSIYAFLLLQRARIFGSAFMLAYVYVFRLPSERLSETVGESRRISSCLCSPPHTHTHLCVYARCAHRYLVHTGEIS